MAPPNYPKQRQRLPEPERLQLLINSRQLEAEEDDFDLNLGALSVGEREDSDELFFADRIGDKMKFPNPQNMAKLRLTPVIQRFDPTDSRVHQLNLKYVGPAAARRESSGQQLPERAR